MRRLAIIVFTVALSVGGFFLFMQNNQPREMTLSENDINRELNEALAADPEVGFLPRVRFETLVATVTETHINLTGTGRWFQMSTGGYPDPVVAFEAQISADPADWQVTNGALVPVGFSNLLAERLATDTRAAGSESDANISGWNRYLLRFIRRAKPFGEFSSAGEDITLTQISLKGDDLIVTVND